LEQAVCACSTALTIQHTQITNILVEKVIDLEGISLIDFLGVENENIRIIAEAFPKCKVVARGDQVRIQGTTPDILKINTAFNSLIAHYHKYGKVTTDNVAHYLAQDKAEVEEREEHDDVLIYGTKGAAIRPKTENQRQMVEAAEKNDLLFALGPAGTGKTFVAVALAVRALKNKQVKRIVITRPAVEAGESLGFLPGDLKEKVDPYLRPIYDALHEMVPAEKLKYYLENNIVEIAPLAYMRGRTLNQAFILLDEAQNTTPMQMKMFLTRMGPDSKMIITGDLSQIDLPRNVRSGLADAYHILKHVSGISFVHLSEKDVVRHRLVRSIIEAYKKTEERQD
jgi:phosphate starvation-inducible PhoH-like protein